MIEFDREGARIAARIRRALENRGTPIPAFDLITASCVISRGGTLVTTDKHFERVEGLKMILLQG